MRFLITLNRTGKQRMLPMDYQYYLSAWIYRVIGKADNEFARFLHSEGYRDGNRSFKLFAYSPLCFGKPTLWKEKALFEIHQDEVTLSVSFFLSDAAERFIIGLFNDQQVFIGDKFNGIDFTVARVERIPDAILSEMMHYRALSPVVVSVLPDGSRYAKYLSPDDAGYAGYLKNTLVRKWNAIPNAPLLNDDFVFDLSITSQPRSKLITVKPNTPQQSKIRGYVFDFDLAAPVEIHRLVIGSGLGEKCSTGFGWVEQQR